MIFVLLDCHHWMPGNLYSKTGQVVECMNCSTFDTFRTVTVVHAVKLVRCALSGVVVAQTMN